MSELNRGTAGSFALQPSYRMAHRKTMQGGMSGVAGVGGHQPMHLLMSGEYYRPPMLPTSEMGLNLNIDDQR